MSNIFSSNLKAFLTLFKLVPADCASHIHPMMDCIHAGFVVLDANNKPVGISEEAFTAAADVFGFNVAELNNTFHKSFGTVKDMEPEQYYTEQILHYFTTYGAESLGISLPTFIPVEKLELPEGFISRDKLTVVRAVDDAVLVEAVEKWVKRTVAPNPFSLALIKPLLSLAKNVPLDEVKSFEVLCLMCEELNVIPENPVSFLRYLVYKTTGETLLIKNKALIARIRLGAAGKGEETKDLLAKADLNVLSSIFLRYKPIFLAFKAARGCAPIINKLRRLAVDNHKPLPYRCLQNAVQIALAGDMDAFRSIIHSADSRDLIKVYNAICGKAYVFADTAGIYTIRNGKTFVRDDAIKAERTAAQDATLTSCLNLVLSELKERLKDYAGMTFLIPSYISYAAPTTEKQFVGAYPYGTRLTIPQDEAFTAGIHWFNVPKKDAVKDDDIYDDGGRVDLDLHLNSVNAHYGWNGDYTDKSDVIFTGDMTDAPLPNGAAEAWYFYPGDETFLLSLNEYCGPNEVDYKLFFSKVKPEAYSRDFTFDPAEAIFAPIPLTIKGGSQNIGLFTKGAFTLYGGSLTSGIVPKANYESFIEGIEHIISCKLMLKELLTKVGAEVVEEMPEDSDEAKTVIDLRPEALTPSTLLELVDGTLVEKAEVA